MRREATGKDIDEALEKSGAPMKRIVIDKAIISCTGCSHERVVNFLIPLRGAEEFIAWTKGLGPGEGPTQCPCGAPKCDIKAHLMEEQ